MNKVTKHDTTAVANATQSRPRGLEHVTHEDYKIPILKIISKMSDAGILEKGKPGDIYNDVSDKVYKGETGFLAVPCFMVTTYNEWAPRGQGSGRPVQIHKDRSILRQTTRNPVDNRDYLPKNNEGIANYVEETGNHFIYILDKDYNPIEQALIPMKSTQRKKSRLWVSRMSQLKQKVSNGFITPDTFKTVWRLKTKDEGNDKGRWHGWLIDFDSHLKNEATIGVCEAFYESIANNSDMYTNVEFAENMPENEVKVPQPKVASVQQTQIKDDDVF